MLRILRRASQEECFDFDLAPGLILTGTPDEIQTGDIIGGLVVTSTAPAQHHNQAAVRVDLHTPLDFRGELTPSAARLVIANTDVEEFWFEWRREFDDMPELERFEKLHTDPVPSGYRPVKARAVEPGMVVLDYDFDMDGVRGKRQPKPAEIHSGPTFGMSTNDELWCRLELENVYEADLVAKEEAPSAVEVFFEPDQILHVRV